MIPTQLHTVWPFLLRGLHDIIKKTHPDWLPEDVFTGLRTGGATCLILWAGPRPIGFTIYHINQLPFSGKKELFVWCSWTIPLRDRLASDEVDKGIAFCFEYLCNTGRAGGATTVAALSPRKGWLKWSERIGMGFKYMHSAYRRDL